MSEFAGREPVLTVAFYRTTTGNEPVREWLRSRTREEQRIVGTRIRVTQYNWPSGMPLVRKLGPHLWEVRCSLKDGIARVLFTVDHGVMVLLHAFVKKTQKTPARDLMIARERLYRLRQE